jgi:DNA-binding beta-propeller fold protein YncE
MIAAPGGSLLITDAIGNRVYQFSTATRTLAIVAGSGATAPAVEGAQAAVSGIQAPTGIARDTDGTLYVAESGTGRILKIGTDGIIHIIAGGGTAAITATAAGATTVRMGGPSGLALGTGGILYIADRELSAVYALTLASGEIKRIVGDGQPGFAGDGGLASEGRIQSPRDIELSADGITMYIADAGNNRVRSMNLTTGILHTYAGSGLTPYNGDYVPAGAANLNLPVELAVSRLGFLFVVDQAHHVVRRATNTF